MLVIFLYLKKELNFSFTKQKILTLLCKILYQVDNGRYIGRRNETIVLARYAFRGNFRNYGPIQELSLQSTR